MTASRLLLLAAVAIGTASSVAAQAATAAPPVVGTWLLEAIVDTLADGSVAYWMGRHPTGAIVYSTTGYMSVQFMRDPRPVLAGAGDAADARRLAGARPFTTLPAEQLRDLLEGYYAYFGRYQLNPAGDSIAHYVETSLRPTEVGVTYHRAVRLEGDLLFLSLHATEDGVPRHRVLTWRRAQVAPMYRELRHHLLLETPRVRIMDVRIRPGDTTLYHHHENTTLYIAINASPTDAQPLGGNWEGTSPTAAPSWEPGQARIDSSYAAEPLTHRVTNVGNRLFRLLAVSVVSNDKVTLTGEIPGRVEATSSWFRQSRMTLAPGETTGWFTAATSLLIVQPLAGHTEVQGATVTQLEAPGAWTLVQPGERYRLRNLGPKGSTALVIQLP